jgi:hypothetical protein
MVHHELILLITMVWFSEGAKLLIEYIYSKEHQEKSARDYYTSEYGICYYFPVFPWTTWRRLGMLLGFQ